MQEGILARMVRVELEGYLYDNFDMTTDLIEVTNDTKLKCLGLDSLDIADFLADFEANHIAYQFVNIDTSNRDITVGDLARGIKLKGEKA